MKFIILHIALLSRVTLLAFVVASSGFTAILRTCVMETMSCCADAKVPQHMECDTEQPGDAPTLSIRADSQCHADILVGGMTTNPAVVEKEHKYQQTKLAIGANVLSFNCFQASPPSLSPLFGHTTAKVFPPSVEKYVLNASFLI